VPEPSTFDYGVVRVVPRVDRGEFMNAGVILYCRTRDFLRARVGLDRRRLEVFSPDADADEIERHLQAIVALCEGRPGAGPIAALPPAERFHWLVAPRSAVIQVSPVHSGLCVEPEAALDHLFAQMVAS
jgi:hypothetical protein